MSRPEAKTFKIRFRNLETAITEADKEIQTSVENNTVITEKTKRVESAHKELVDAQKDLDTALRAFEKEPKMARLLAKARSLYNKRRALEEEQTRFYEPIIERIASSDQPFAQKVDALNEIRREIMDQQLLTKEQIAALDDFVVTLVVGSPLPAIPATEKKRKNEAKRAW